MPKNDRLAVYGDSAAAFYLCSIWVQRGLDKNCWTMLRYDLISNENPARVGMGHGLDTCINVNGGTVRVTPGMVATAVEAILGAVERDGGHDTLARVMAHLGLTQHTLISLVPPWLPWDNLLCGHCGPDIQAGTFGLRTGTMVTIQEGTLWRLRSLDRLVHEEAPLRRFPSCVGVGGDSTSTEPLIALEVGQ
ncbi:hypothetical protein AU210_016332 [Fusarium oxysporum f. sp. radicis-cucumerinum]|uniref:RNase III domain-containing protein n=1 Tax=Fusarium oxysporum f. sp. radicis-cucumerinum TaxID=327505 RepID=A0A2H3FNX3_FUSOX|nr:hypothetical protein AU210_016332 [Fusarium oxysporum f. sp. radicis-cucumerinum]